MDTHVAPPGASPATPSQSVRPTDTPAERGGAGGTTVDRGASAGRLNLDGSTGGASTAPGAAAGNAGAGANPAAPLNLDLHGAGSMGPTAGRSRTGLLPAVPAPAEKPNDKLEKDIDKASRASCGTAYAGAGILAVIPLARDAVTGKGCKW